MVAPRPLRLLASLLFVLPIAPLYAQEGLSVIELTNGDQLTGLIDRAKSTLTHVHIESSALGSINVPVKSIQSVSSVNAVSASDSQSLSGDVSFSFTRNFSSNANASLYLDASVDFDSDSISNEFDASVQIDDSLYDSEAIYELSDKFDFSISPALSLHASLDYEDAGQSFDFGNQYFLGSLGLAYKVFDSDVSSLVLSLAPSLHSVDGGESCHFYSQCGDSFYATKLLIRLNHVIDRYFSLNLENSFTATHAAGSIYSKNKFISELDFKPFIDSDIFARLRYTNVFSQLSSTEFDHSVKILLGSKF